MQVPTKRKENACVCVEGCGGWGLVMLIFRINCVFMPVTVTVTPPEVGQLGSDNN